MAEINKITVFKNALGVPSYGLVDDQHRVVVSLDSTSNGKYIQGFSGSVTAGTDYLIISYTVPAGKVFTVSSWEADGPAHAIFQLKEGSTVIAQQRNSVAQPTVGDSLEVGLDMVAGTVLSITVDHSATGKTVDFSGTIYGTERDA